MKLIERDGYLRKLIDVMGTPDIKVITGVRRSGKSKLMERFKAYILEQNDNVNIIHINFNLAQYEALQEYHALHDYIEEQYDAAKDNFVLIDEIQINSFSHLSSINGFRSATIWYTKPLTISRLILKVILIEITNFPTIYIPSC